jgi:hypothetical protein
MHPWPRSQALCLQARLPPNRQLLGRHSSERSAWARSAWVSYTYAVDQSINQSINQSTNQSLGRSEHEVSASELASSVGRARGRASGAGVRGAVLCAGECWPACLLPATTTSSAVQCSAVQKAQLRRRKRSFDSSNSTIITKIDIMYYNGSSSNGVKPRSKTGQLWGRSTSLQIKVQSSVRRFQVKGRRARGRKKKDSRYCGQSGEGGQACMHAVSHTFVQYILYGYCSAAS